MKSETSHHVVDLIEQKRVQAIDRWHWGVAPFPDHHVYTGTEPAHSDHSVPSEILHTQRSQYKIFGSSDM